MVVLVEEYCRRNNINLENRLTNQKIILNTKKHLTGDQSPENKDKVNNTIRKDKKNKKNLK